MYEQQTIQAELLAGPFDGERGIYTGSNAILYTAPASGLEHRYVFMGVICGVALYAHVGVNTGQGG